MASKMTPALRNRIYLLGTVQLGQHRREHVFTCPVARECVITQVMLKGGPAEPLSMRAGTLELVFRNPLSWSSAGSTWLIHSEDGGRARVAAGSVITVRVLDLSNRTHRRLKLQPRWPFVRFVAPQLSVVCAVTEANKRAAVPV